MTEEESNNLSILQKKFEINWEETEWLEKNFNNHLADYLKEVDQSVVEDEDEDSIVDQNKSISVSEDDDEIKEEP